MSADQDARPEGSSKHSLSGIVFGETGVTDIRGRQGELRYRGYAIEDLAIDPDFESTVYLLLHRQWPTTGQRFGFRADLAARRSLPRDAMQMLRRLGDKHPDDALRTVVSSLDLGQRDGREPLQIGLDLIAKIPSLVTVGNALRSGRDPLDPDPALDHASDFLRRLLGRLPSEIEQRAVNLDFVLHADHGANPSAFAGRLAAGNGTDMVGAITGAIAAFTGPREGGAIAAADAILSELAAPADVPAFVARRERQGRAIQGFGRSVYRTRDPRRDLYRHTATALAALAGDDREIAVLDALIEAMAPLRRMGVGASIHLHTATLYRLLGLPAELATSTFIAGRSVGWVAQILEQQENGMPVRSKSRYIGPGPRGLPGSGGR